MIKLEEESVRSRVVVEVITRSGILRKGQSWSKGRLLGGGGLFSYEEKKSLREALFNKDDGQC